MLSLPLSYVHKAWLMWRGRAKSKALHRQTWTMERMNNYSWVLFSLFCPKKKKKKNVFKWSLTLHLTICQQTCHFQNWCLHKSGDRSQRVHTQGGTAVFPGAAEKQQSHPAFPLSTIVRGQAVSHPQTQERPDSRREAIYTDASSAEWNVMFCGWHRSPGRTCEASWWWPIPSAVHLCSHWSSHRHGLWLDQWDPKNKTRKLL